MGVRWQILGAFVHGVLAWERQTPQILEGGIVYAKGGKRVGKSIAVFAKKAQRGKNSEKAARWVRKRKREELARIGKSIKPDSVREWAAAAARSKTPSEGLPHNFRRWRAGLSLRKSPIKAQSISTFKTIFFPGSRSTIS